jgi:hypothetical protein
MRTLPDNKTLIEKLLKIRDKRGQQVPFRLNPAQEYYWKRKTRRNLILKARQKGISKLIDADQLIDCVTKPTNAVVISHEQEATKRLFAAVRYFIDNMEVKPVLSIDSKREIRFPKRGSSYFIGTAGQRAFGRGDTVDRAHLSEAAFYDSLERILGGIAEAAEYGQIDIETTANGRGEFYDLWMKAKAGRSSYTPIFIPWFIDNEYSVESMTEDEKQGMSTGIQEMFAIPDRDFMGTLDEQEKILLDRAKKEWGVDITPGQLKWRRYKIWDKGLLFFQEYPEDDVSCFLQSGRPVFREITTNETIRKPLEKGVRYFAGLDGAEGVEGGDNHCFVVLDTRSMEGHRPHFCFEYCSNEPIEVFDAKVAKICLDFDIILGVEKQGVGVAHLNKLRELGVAAKEWNTTSVNRPVMLTELEEAYRTGAVVETYLEAEREARNLQYDSNNRADHPAGKHDDRVFARAIALQVSRLPIPRITNL